MIYLQLAQGIERKKHDTNKENMGDIEEEENKDTTSMSNEDSSKTRPEVNQQDQNRDTVATTSTTNISNEENLGSISINKEQEYMDKNATIDNDLGSTAATRDTNKPNDTTMQSDFLSREDKEKEKRRR